MSNEGCPIVKDTTLKFSRSFHGVTLHISPRSGFLHLWQQCILEEPENMFIRITEIYFRVNSVIQARCCVVAEISSGSACGEDGVGQGDFLESLHCVTSAGGWKHEPLLTATW